MKKGEEMQAIVEFFKANLSKEMAVFIISMIPVIELRGAIPVGMGMGLSFKKSFIISYIGSTLPSLPILFLIEWIFDLLSRINIFDKLITKIREKTLSKRDQIDKYGYWGLFLFVGIPLPGTGIWSGSLLAVLLGLDKKKSFLSIALGNLLAGIIISIISGGFFSLVR